jgi:hypothetical protein
MSRTHLSIAVIAFVAGCAGSAAAKLVVPPARAQNVQRWEYLAHSDVARIESAEWKRLGEEGWDLAGVSGALYIFKRPLE